MAAAADRGARRIGHRGVRRLDGVPPQLNLPWSIAKTSPHTRRHTREGGYPVNAGVPEIVRDSSERYQHRHGVLGSRLRGNDNREVTAQNLPTERVLRLRGNFPRSVDRGPDPLAVSRASRCSRCHRATAHPASAFIITASAGRDAALSAALDAAADCRRSGPR